ncbi:gatB/GatE catalytic domain-containing protein [Phthorimaea operculella]|nr:gatB/GatE catalytic domain-containing protein [Phthorimaea operculella]
MLKLWIFFLSSLRTTSNHVFTPGVHKKPYSKSSKIKQIQLEQDSGKSLHDAELKRSLVDLNRAGAPLIELVFEPDLEDGEEAAALVKELVLIVQRLGACTARMEEGALRVDANVSLRRPGDPLSTRTEIKNIGSVRGVAGAIKHEIERQRVILDSGGTIANETRSWDAANRVTVAMRDKETVQDYRYMPEPNLPPLRVNLNTKEDTRDVISVPLIQDRIPELPEATRKHLIQDFGLRPETAIQLVNEPILLEYFQELTSENRNPTKVANLLLNDLLTVLNKRKVDLEECPITTKQMKEMTDLLLNKDINLDVFRKLVDELLDSCDSDDSPARIIKEKGWAIVSDQEEIIKHCTEVINSNPKLVKQYKEGKTKVFKALLGILAKNTQVLSPIPEEHESTASPHVAVARLETYSPLPDLVIEKQRRYYYEDETEEFYSRLEVKMKRFYRKLFLGESIDIEDISDNSVPDYYSRDEPGDIQGDETRNIDDDKEYETENTDAEEIHEEIEDEEEDATEREASRDDKIEDDSTEHIMSVEDVRSENQSVTESESSETTSSGSAEKPKTTQEKLAEMIGKIFSLSSSEESLAKEGEDSTRKIISQTYTEQPEQSDGSSSTRNKTESESSGPIIEVITERAMIHAEPKNVAIEDKQLEAEVTRRQSAQSYEDRFIRPDNTEEQRSNSHTNPMEEQTIKASVPMELDSVVVPSIITTPPLQDISPVEASTPIIQTVKKRAHECSKMDETVDKEKKFEQEVMRRQEIYSINDSYIHLDDSKDEILNLNIRHTMEQSSVNTTVSMEVDSFLHLPRNITPLQEISPVVQWKRPARTELFNVAAKRKRTNNRKEIGERHDENKENLGESSREIASPSVAKEKKRDTREKDNEIHTVRKDSINVATVTGIELSSKEIQVNITKPTANVEAQTGTREVQNASTEVFTVRVEAGVQTEDESHWVECRNAATQTAQPETADESTQTPPIFEFYRLFHGINFFFIF